MPTSSHRKSGTLRLCRSYFSVVPKSLRGDNFYGNRFHTQCVGLAATCAKLKKVLAAADPDGSHVEEIERLLTVIKSSDTAPKPRAEALKALRLLVESQIIPAIEALAADPIPASEQVLPMSVVSNTRGYIERVVLQANGCYEHQWFDACSVMIRRLVETLIIEVYRALGAETEIKDSSDNFLMLSALVDKILNNHALHLGRETKRGLPLVKSLGDRSAHNPFFIAKKEDIDKVIPDLRVIVDELLHRARIKK